jgi:fluoride exporter
MTRFLWVCLGGAVGTGARYGLSTWTARRFGPLFPWGTLAVNVIGSFLIGAVMQVGVATGRLSPDLRVVLATGVLGGFTTYSSFNYETVRYFQESAWLLGALNLALMVVGCLAAGFAGIAVARGLGAN